MVKSVWYVLAMEVAVFAFEMAVYIYTLTLGHGDDPDTYRSTRFYRTIITLFLILLAVDGRRLFKGYIVLFILLLVAGIIKGIDATLFLPKSNMTAYILTLISAWAHVGSDLIILCWYKWLLGKQKKKRGDDYVDASSKQYRSTKMLL